MPRSKSSLQVKYENQHFTRTQAYLQQRDRPYIAHDGIPWCVSWRTYDSGVCTRRCVLCFLECGKWKVGMVETSAKLMHIVPPIIVRVVYHTSCLPTSNCSLNMPKTDIIEHRLIQSSLVRTGTTPQGQHTHTAYRVVLNHQFSLSSS